MVKLKPLPACVHVYGFSQLSPGRIRFGLFEADLRTGELRKGGVKVRIEDLSLRALTVLLNRPGEIISRGKLWRTLWPENVFVDFGQGISGAVRGLPDTLGDSADNPLFIETVERRGHRSIAPVHLRAAPGENMEGKKDGEG